MRNVQIDKQPPQVIDVAAPKGNHRHERPIDVQAKGLGEAREHHLFGGTFAEDHETGKIELGVGSHSLANEFRSLVRDRRQSDPSHAAGAGFRVEAEMTDLLGLHPRQNAWRMAREHGLSP